MADYVWLTKAAFLAMMEAGYKNFNEVPLGGPGSRLRYVAEDVFGFTTYHEEVSELFGQKALEVVKAISEQKTYDYIEAPDNRLWFLIMVNMPFFQKRLEWGASIRGAWWKDSGVYKVLLSGEGGVKELSLDYAEWVELLAAVEEFVQKGTK